jgi:hypothetical protein
MWWGTWKSPQAKSGFDTISILIIKEILDKSNAILVY